MKTKIVDIQEFNTTMGILRIETRISEVNDFRSVVENKISKHDACETNAIGIFISTAL